MKHAIQKNFYYFFTGGGKLNFYSCFFFLFSHFLSNNFLQTPSLLKSNRPKLLINSLIWCILILPPLYSFSQVEYATCGNEGMPDHEHTGNPEQHCFNVEEVFETCTPVYVRINLHFFTSADGASVIPIGWASNNSITQTISQSMVYSMAEQFVENANSRMENNAIPWHGGNTEAACNPIRFVLSGVYVHRNDNPVGGTGNPSTHDLQAQYAVNAGTEYNYYIANFPGGANGHGPSTYGMIDWMETGNFIHELGHTMSLAHSWVDNCPDTDNLTQNWDKNCDGTYTFSSNGALNEVGFQCWSYIGPDQNGNPPSSAPDANNNSIYDCAESDQNPACEDSPCCDWSNIDNNIMSYSAFKDAFSECQVLKMLTELAEVECDFVEGVGICPPPVAFITQTPLAENNTEFCTECLILEVSANEDEYLLEIFEVFTGNVAYSSGWQSGNLNNFCFSTGTGTFQKNRLKPNTEYEVRLKVENYCGDLDEAVYTFVTPDGDCSIPGSPPGSEALSISPNPGSGSIIVSFMDDSNQHYILMSTELLTGGHELLLSEFRSIEGQNFINLNISELFPGTYNLSLIGENLIRQGQFIKL